METYDREKMYQRNVNVYLEANPNPNSLKFVVNFMLVPEGTNYDFPDADSAKNAPLAQELFNFSFVERVFYMSNFITITKSESVEWAQIKDELRSFIKEYLDAEKPLLNEEAKNEANAPEAAEEESDVAIKIRGILDEYIKPAVEQDGGAIGFHSYEDGVVKVDLQGSCSGCPSSMVTLKAGIENLLKRFVPEVESVEAREL